MISTLRKIIAILLNMKKNKPKLINVCRCKLAKSWQNFTENVLNLSENTEKSLGVLF